MVRKRLHLVVMLPLLSGLSGCVRDDLRLADRCLALGDEERALALYASVLDRVPENVRARRGSGLSLLALASERAEDGNDMPEHWSRAVRELVLADTLTDSVVQEGLVEGRTRWARSLAERGDTLRAEEILEDLVVASPLRTRPRHSLAVLLARAGRTEQAEELFLRNAVIDSTDVDTWFNLGLLSWNASRPLEAIHFFLKAQRLAPTDPEVVWWVAKASRSAR